MKAIRALLCVVVLGIGCWLAVGAGRAAEPKERRGTIVHCVFFWLKDTATKEDVATLIRDCKEMLAPLPCVKQLDVGTPVVQERGAPVDSTYQVGITVCFDDAQGYETYQKHPEHLKLIEKHKPFWQKVVVYDFVCQ